MLEKLYWKLAYWTPKKVVYFCAMRLMAHATTGHYGDTVVPELTAMEAVSRWAKDHWGQGTRPGSRHEVKDGELRIRYKGEPDPEVDGALGDCLRGLGYERWASGYNLETGVRDLAFDAV